MVAAVRVVFFGTPQFAVPSLEALLDSRHTGVRRRDAARPAARPRTARHRRPGQGARASSRHLPVLQPATLEDPAVAGDASWPGRPTSASSPPTGRLIPDALLALPRLGHDQRPRVAAAEVPRRRAGAPRGDRRRHRHRRHDHARGAEARRRRDVRHARHAPIGPDETSDAVETRPVAHRARGCWSRSWTRSPPAPLPKRPQDEALATYARKLTKAEGVLDWTQPARTLHNRVRGLHPWPHASTYLDGARLIVLESRAAPTTPTPERAGHHRARRTATPCTWRPAAAPRWPCSGCSSKGAGR